MFNFSMYLFKYCLPKKNVAFSALTSFFFFNVKMCLTIQKTHTDLQPQYWRTLCVAFRIYDNRTCDNQ